jgi:mono/diheme cytochrome c family protein
VRKVFSGLLVALGLMLFIQLIPYGGARENPAVVSGPDWDQSRTRELFSRACKDCHSNQTEWPWYSSIAPASWLVYRDVSEGRSHFNVSEWGRDENHGDEAAKLVRDGEMPPWFYLPAHPEARLSDVEREELVAGLMATFPEEKDHHSDSRDHAH